jgi:HsdM N-terminal domain
MADLSNLSNFIQDTADIISDTFKRGKYQDVILPFTVLRRIGCVLEPTDDKMIEANARFGATFSDLSPQLRKASAYAFYNTSLYTFTRLLLRKLPVRRDELPVEIQQNIAIESCRLRQTSKGKIVMERGTGKIDPILSREYYNLVPEEIELLSQIIEEFNARFGTNFSEEDKPCIHKIETRLTTNAALEASVRVNPPENARLSFDHVVTDLPQDMVDGHFKFYKQVNDDPEFSKVFLDWLFQRYLERNQMV